MRNLLLFLIRAYRYLISPWLGNHCRFYPSCSAYALEAITLHGAWHGAWLAVKRLLRCHPWHPGGVDLVPQPHTHIDSPSSNPQRTHHHG